MAGADDGVPPARIAVLSDDLTGANAVAATFASHGATAFTALGPAPLMAPPDAAVLVVDTATRDAAPAAAAEAVRAAANAVQAWGARLLAKRIDTTLRGCIVAETAALLDVLAPDTLAVLVPAAPDAGRACVGGRVFVDGQPVSAVTDGPDEPLRLFAAQAPTLAAVGCPLATVRRGPDAVRVALRQAAASGARVVVCDAETRADVTTLAAGAATLGCPVLPVDPGGFTRALARTRGLISEVELRSPGGNTSGRALHGRVLAVLGSPAAITARQIETAVAQGWLTRLPVDGAALAAGHDAARHEVARALTALSTAPTPAVGIDPVPREGEDAPARAPAVAHGLARLVAAVLAQQPAVGLFLTGGTVARAVLERLGAHGVWVEQEVVPLAALGQIADGPYAGLTIVTKGGMVGGTDALVRCLAALDTGARRSG